MIPLRRTAPSIRSLRILPQREPAVVGKAIERRFARAARENRKSEMMELARIGRALTVRSLIAATSRHRPNDRDVPRSRTVIELAAMWRVASGQTLPLPVAYHIGKKLIDEQVYAFITGRTSRKATEERAEALTQLLSIVEPKARVSAHAHLLSRVNDRVMMEHIPNSMCPGDDLLTREELQGAVNRRIRRVESQGYEFLGRSAMHAAAFDEIEAGYSLIA